MVVYCVEAKKMECGGSGGSGESGVAVGATVGSHSGDENFYQTPTFYVLPGNRARAGRPLALFAPPLTSFSGQIFPQHPRFLRLPGTKEVKVDHLLNLH